MATQIRVASDLCSMFRAGPNIRVRHVDGITSIKPTSRKYAVKAELSFGRLEKRGDLMEGHFNAEVPAGNFNVAPQRYGWFHLVEGEGITLSQISLPIVSEFDAPAVVTAEQMTEVAAETVCHGPLNL